MHCATVKKIISYKLGYILQIQRIQNVHLFTRIKNNNRYEYVQSEGRRGVMLETPYLSYELIVARKVEKFPSLRKVKKFPALLTTKKHSEPSACICLSLGPLHFHPPYFYNVHVGGVLRHKPRS
jgi:hypothetical protein